jgi:hypothetical protein
MTKPDAVQAELEKIAEKHDGLLRAADVVEFAENPETALHKHFDWDDSEAGRKWREHQARLIINARVIVLEQDNEPIIVRAFESLKTDRHSEGGYRSIVNILSNEQHRQQLLTQALDDMRAFERKYHTLKEVAPIIEQIRLFNESPKAELAAD